MIFDTPSASSDDERVREQKNPTVPVSYSAFHMYSTPALQGENEQHTSHPSAFTGSHSGHAYLDQFFAEHDAPKSLDTSRAVTPTNEVGEEIHLTVTSFDALPSHVKIGHVETLHVENRHLISLPDHHHHPVKKTHWSASKTTTKVKKRTNATADPIASSKTTSRKRNSLKKTTTTTKKKKIKQQQQKIVSSSTTTQRKRNDKPSTQQQDPSTLIDAFLSSSKSSEVHDDKMSTAMKQKTGKRQDSEEPTTQSILKPITSVSSSLTSAVVTSSCDVQEGEKEEEKEEEGNEDYDRVNHVSSNDVLAASEKNVQVDGTERNGKALDIDPLLGVSENEAIMIRDRVYARMEAINQQKMSFEHSKQEKRIHSQLVEMRELTSRVFQDRLNLETILLTHDKVISTLMPKLRKLVLEHVEDSYLAELTEEFRLQQFYATSIQRQHRHRKHQHHAPLPSSVAPMSLSSSAAAAGGGFSTMARQYSRTARTIRQSQQHKRPKSPKVVLSQTAGGATSISQQQEKQEQPRASYGSHRQVFPVHIANAHVKGGSTQLGKTALMTPSATMSQTQSNTSRIIAQTARVMPRFRAKKPVQRVQKQPEQEGNNGGHEDDQSTSVVASHVMRKYKRMVGKPIYQSHLAATEHNQLSLVDYEFLDALRSRTVAQSKQDALTSGIPPSASSLSSSAASSTTRRKSKQRSSEASSSGNAAWWLEHLSTLPPSEREVSMSSSGQSS